MLNSQFSAPVFAGGEGRASLVSEGVDGIEPRCLARWVEAEEDSDTPGDQEGDDDRARTDHDRPACGLAEEDCCADAEEDSGESADERERDRFEEKLKENMAALRADGHANADLARPFGDGDEHDVHDADPSHEERDGGNRQNQIGHRTGLLGAGLHDLGLCAETKIRWAVRGEPVSLSEKHINLLHGLFDASVADGRSDQRSETGIARKTAHESRVWDDDEIVMIRTGHAAPFSFE